MTWISARSQHSDADSQAQEDFKKMPYANGYCMKLPLQATSDAVPQGHHAVVVMDGAVWHQPSYSLPNVTIFKATTLLIRVKPG